ncbi:hypothetical protein LY76DRAFT_191177 [Colletotrichum caudatum]|nr:hypothetical protein LY76DRAFT_191177 [Colletotrichum caudatum]
MEEVDDDQAVLCAGTWQPHPTSPPGTVGMARKPTPLAFLQSKMLPMCCCLAKRRRLWPDGLQKWTPALGKKPPVRAHETLQQSLWHAPGVAMNYLEGHSMSRTHASIYLLLCKVCQPKQPDDSDRADKPGVTLLRGCIGNTYRKESGRGLGGASGRTFQMPVRLECLLPRFHFPCWMQAGHQHA